MEGATLLIPHATIVKYHVNKQNMVQIAIEFERLLMPEGGAELLGGIYGSKHEQSIKFMIQKNMLEKKSSPHKEESNPLAQKFFKNMLVDNPKFFEFLSSVAQCEISTTEEAHDYVKIMMEVESLSEITEVHTKKVMDKYLEWRKENGH